MMTRDKIRLNSSSSIHSFDEDSFLDVGLETKNKPLPTNDYAGIVNSYRQFLKERNESDRYRLIFTINPYCSNVLFNTLTEIVKDEGSDDYEFVKYETNVSGALGKEKPTRVDMIRNTEYNSSKLGYVYHCGYDIFNNHILRNKSFKIVNQPKSRGQEIFNTLGDIQRDGEGNPIVYKFKRINVENVNENNNRFRHLYEYSDIRSITDSINDNLTEENGWFGFVNKSNIEVRDNDGNLLDINYVINTNKACEFIDLYPDRSLFSFNPKVNRHRRRLEYNWDVCLTYPYDTVNEHHIFRNAEYDVVGLCCVSCKSGIGLNGDNVLVLRSAARHNLQRNDKIKLICIKGGTVYEYPRPVIVKDTGDLNKDYRENFFYINNDDNMILSEMGFTGDVDSITDEMLEECEFRFVHIVNGFESEYYIRRFRKIPNWKKTEQELTEEIALDRKKFNEFIDNNAREEKGNTESQMLPFNHDMHQLAFSSNIYSDNSTQLVFTDSIDLKHLKDRFGKDVHEIFLTVVKRNKGWNIWYDDNKKNEEIEEIEFSHCFGKVTSGFDLLKIKGDDVYKMGIFSDVKLLHNLSFYIVPSSVKLEEDTDDEVGITSDMEYFLGDLVEFNRTQVKEIVLEEVNYRFNTTQRELEGDENFCEYRYDEIVADDFDQGDFAIEENIISAFNGTAITQRPEGYYHKAHYPIAVKELSSKIQQSAYVFFTIEDGGIEEDDYFVNARNAKVTTKHKHKLKRNDYLRVSNKDDSRKYHISFVEAVINDHQFIMDIPDGYSFDSFKSYVENGDVRIMKENFQIPSYAVNLGDGSERYLWREVQRVGDVKNNTLHEYTFTNGHFYIHKQLNFFLKRQDPYNYSGLQITGFPNDIVGNKETGLSDYEYVKEMEALC